MVTPILGKACQFPALVSLEDQTAYDSMTGRNGWDGVFLDAQDVMSVSRQVNPYSLLRKHKVDHEARLVL